MVTLNLNPMGLIRGIACQAVDSHFNQIAYRNGHSDLLALVRGDTENHPIRAREAERAKIISEILAAPSPAAVEQVLKNAGIQPPSISSGT